MKNLTDCQKDFILNSFFILKDYAGWLNIASKLLEVGNCIVAGDECIWKGGIGNFISTSSAEDFHGCIKYSFDLEKFLKSEYFKYVKESKIEEIERDMNLLSFKYENINNL